MDSLFPAEVPLRPAVRSRAALLQLAPRGPSPSPASCPSTDFQRVDDRCTSLDIDLGSATIGVLIFVLEPNEKAKKFEESVCE